jgi:fatty-acid desaturase
MADLELKIVGIFAGLVSLLIFGGFILLWFRYHRTFCVQASGIAFIYGDVE